MHAFEVDNRYKKGNVPKGFRNGVQWFYFVFLFKNLINF